MKISDWQCQWYTYCKFVDSLLTFFNKLQNLETNSSHKIAKDAKKLSVNNVVSSVDLHIPNYNMECNRNYYPTRNFYLTSKETPKSAAKFEKIKENPNKSTNRNNATTSGILQILKDLEKINEVYEDKKKTGIIYELEKTQQQIDVAAIQLLKLNQFIADKAKSNSLDCAENNASKLGGDKAGKLHFSKQKSPVNEKKETQQPPKTLHKIKTKHSLPNNLVPKGKPSAQPVKGNENFRKAVCSPIFKFKGTLESIAEETETEVRLSAQNNQSKKSVLSWEKKKKPIKANSMRKRSSSVTVLMQPKPGFESNKSSFNLIKGLKEKSFGKKNVEKPVDLKCVVMQNKTCKGKINSIKKDQKPSHPLSGPDQRPNIVVEDASKTKSNVRVFKNCVVFQPTRKLNMYPIVQYA